MNLWNKNWFQIDFQWLFSDVNCYSMISAIKTDDQELGILASLWSIVESDNIFIIFHYCFQMLKKQLVEIYHYLIQTRAVARGVQVQLHPLIFRSQDLVLRM